MIQVRALSKLYESHVAVRELSFAIPTGSICGLVGPNGAGKTTTMRCLAGLLPPTTGQMLVDGLDVKQQAMEVRRRLAYIPDEPPLFDDLSVYQHLQLVAQLHRVADFSRKAITLLNQFELDSKSSALAGTLSRGMRQKLAVCCAYLYEPKVLLLDEPLTGLDPAGIRQLLESLRQRAQAGATVVLSSHLLAMIEDICTDVVVMRQGEIRYSGSTSGLRALHPEVASLEAAYFTSINTPVHAGTSLPVPGLEVSLPSAMHSSTAALR